MSATFLRLAHGAARARRHGLALVLCRLAGVQRTDAPAPFNEAVDLLLQAGADGIMVAAGVGAVRVVELQKAGGRRLAATAFLAGTPVTTGTRFGA